MIEKDKQKRTIAAIGNPHGIPIEVEDEYEEEDYTSPQSVANSRRGKEKVIDTQKHTGNNKRSNQVVGYFQPRATTSAQKSIKFALTTKKMVDAADMVVSRWLFDANIPFKDSHSKYYQAMADAILSIGPGYKLSSYHDLRGKLLKKNVTEVKDFLSFFKASWSQTAYSIMVDGWTDEAKAID